MNVETCTQNLSFLFLGNKNGAAATAATDNLHGDGGECNISNNPYQTDQCGVSTPGCDISVCFNVCQSTSTFSYNSVSKIWFILCIYSCVC